MENKQPAGKRTASSRPAPKTAPVKTTATPAKKNAPSAQAAAPLKKPVSAKKPSPAGKSAANPPAKKRKKHSKKRARRIRRIRNICIGAAALLMMAALIFHMTCAVVAGQVHPLSAGTIDLRGRGISTTRGLDRMRGLTQALLSDNGLTDVSSLANLTNCGYIDLTGNPVTPESYAALRNALPGCLILCEAEDYTVTELSLGGYELPDAEALANVFASHRALRLVDLRGTDITQAEADSLRDQFPHISFVHAAGSEDTVMVNLDSAAEASEALSRVSDALHVTVTGCAFTPDEYRRLKEQFPGTEIDCMISVYGLAVTPDAAHIDLSSVTPDGTLEETLRLFGNLRSLSMGEMLPAEAARLKMSLGLDGLIYKYNGFTVSPETAEIDLHDAPGFIAEQLTALMEALPAGTAITMGTPDEQLLAVIEANKDRMRFAYEVQALGRTFSSADEIIDLGDDVEDEDVEELQALIDQLPALKEMHMYESRLSKESMDLLFDSNPDIFFGWTFRMCKGKYVVRTDITAFGSELGAPLHTYTEDDFEQLRYCKNLEALDLCHNAIEDLEFMRSFPHMKLLILGDNDITDISPLADLKELEFLELFMNYHLTDYSPLLELENLTDLNVRCPGGKADRLSADDFMGITSLERFWASYRHMSKEEEARLREALPDCEISVTKDHSTGDDWRGGGRQEVIERVIKSRTYEPFP